MKTTRTVFFVLSSCLIAVGCSNTEFSDVEIPVGQISEVGKRHDKTTEAVTLTPRSSTESPAARHFEIPSQETEPTEICRKFLEFLNREDVQYFELLMTPAALNVIGKTGFHLPPVAEPDVDFELSAPQFSSIRQKICFVDCRFDATSEEPATDLKLMLRRIKAGWRIAGMIVEDEAGGWGNLLSFESSTDIEQIEKSLEVSAAASMD